MDTPDDGRNLEPVDPADATEGHGSSLELGKVKHVLSIKMEKPDAHYTTITPLGKGSFGEVHSAQDTLLGREVAIKSLKQQYRNEEEVVDRFLKEARGTAQLEHPNIMPVHEMGVTDELGIYFTMKKIHGENLKEILDRLQANTSFYQKKYPLNVLLEIFLAVCNGVAFAHSKGVIHRDLKPANIMIGEYGEVLILDWGLVKQLDTAEGTRSGVQLRMDEFNDGSSTLDGAVSGTPNYMSPEQAEGHIDEVDFQSDIYSLGAILYHILTHLPPFEKTQLRKLLENVKAGKFDPPRKRRPELRIPRELEAVCLKAMSRFQVNRYHSVERFAEDIRNYIGHREVSAYRAPRHVRFWKACRRNPIKSSVAVAVLVALGFAFVAQRSMLEGSYRNNMDIATSQRKKAEESVQSAMLKIGELRDECAGIMVKAESDQEKQLNEELNPLLHDINRQFNIAQSYLDNIPEQVSRRKAVRENYIGIFQSRLDFAFFRNDLNAVAELLGEAKKRFELLNRPIPKEVQDIIDAAEAKMVGIGSLELTASDNVEQVLIFAVKEIHGRLLLDQETAIAKRPPPIEEPEVPHGSYMALVTMANGGGTKPYPIFIERGEHKVVHLDFPDEYPEGMAFVPDGQFIFGGTDSRFYRRKVVGLDAFYIKAKEVTFAEYLEFWNSLTDAALRQAYRSRVQFDADERMFHDAWDNNGNLLYPDKLAPGLPVVGITHQAAGAFCEWKGRQLGAVIRLPTVKEWEKAARGVDGRTYVWGNGLNTRYTLTKNNTAAKGKFPFLAPPASFRLTDASPYNVFDMAGNVREMTSTPLPGTDNFFQLKGGSASTPDNFLPAAYSSDTPVAPSDVGFRYVMEMPKKP